MEASIIENMGQLYRSHIVTSVIYLALIVVAVLVTIGAVKFKLLDTKTKNIALVSTVAVCSALLIGVQVFTVLPVYKDYTEQSYILLDNATMIIEEGATGIINRTNTVTVLANGVDIKLKMETDYSLSSETEYIGKVAYLKHSEYVVWYSFDN